VQLHQRRWVSVGDGERGRLQSSVSAFKSRIPAVLKALILFSPLPTPCVSLNRTRHISISSNSKSAQIARGGENVFPLPIKMEEQLLSWEQHHAHAAASPSQPSLTLHLPRSSHASPTRGSFPAEPGGFSAQSSLNVPLRKTPTANASLCSETPTEHAGRRRGKAAASANDDCAASAAGPLRRGAVWG